MSYQYAWGSSLKHKVSALLLISAALTMVLFQAGCSGVTSAASNADANSLLSQFRAQASSLNLGNVAVGDSKTVSLTFTNTSSSPVTVTSTSVTGAGFSISGISNGATFNPGQSATLNVTFVPSAVGSVTGSITAVTSDGTVTVTVQAAGVPAGDHLANLSWSASPSALGYNVYRSTSSGGSFTRLNSSLNSTTAYTDSAVQAGQSYFYVVTAVNSSNMESGYSNEVQATIPSP